MGMWISTAIANMQILKEQNTICFLQPLDLELSLIPKVRVKQIF